MADAASSSAHVRVIMLSAALAMFVCGWLADLYLGWGEGKGEGRVRGMFVCG